jgi:hypothetical protein
VTYRDFFGCVTLVLESAFTASGNFMAALLRAVVAVGAVVRVVIIAGFWLALLSGVGGLAYLLWGHPERIGIAIGVIAIPLVLRFFLAGFTQARRATSRTDQNHLESRDNPASINFSGRR